MSVSVIIPVHNDAKYLKKSIDSALDQECVDDIIVVDDASNEENMEIVLDIHVEYFEVSYIRNEVNYGLSGSRNEGVHYANGKWIVPLDCGDWFYPGGLDALYESSQEGYADVLYGNITDKHDTSHPKHHIAKPRPTITKEEFMSPVNPLFCSSLFKKEIWRKAGGYTMYPFSHYEDYSFWMKCFSVGAKFKYVDTLVYHHENDGNSMLSELHSNTNEYKKLARRSLEYGNNKKCYVPKFVNCKYIEI